MRKSSVFLFFFCFCCFCLFVYIFKLTGNRRCKEYTQRERKEELCACAEERRQGGRASHTQKCIMVEYGGGGPLLQSPHFKSGAQNNIGCNSGWAAGGREAGLGCYFNFFLRQGLPL